jgi:hypothetical protein
MQVRRRPQPNRRRGLIRAGAAVVLLIAIIVAVLLVVASLTAPPAKAPTVPASPGPATPLPTPLKTSTHAKATRTPHAAPTPKRTKASLGSGNQFAQFALGDNTPHSLLVQSAYRSSVAAASPSRRWIAYFAKVGNKPLHRSLQLFDVKTGRTATIARGDSYVRPVWSPDSQFLLYMQVRSTHAFPGARWSLMQIGVNSRRSRRLSVTNALNVLPLGWSRGRILYTVANSTDTSVYMISHGHAVFSNILMPQVLTSGSLSPNGRYVAFSAPTNCGYCTLDVFDLVSFDVWIGPTGLPNEASMAWTSDSRTIVAPLGHQLATIDVERQDVRLHPAPAHLPRVWAHSMRAIVSPGHVAIEDTVTGKTFRSLPAQKFHR